jgi:hypothetical protein
MVIPTPRASITAVPKTCQARPTRSRSAALNNSSNDTLKCSKTRIASIFQRPFRFLPSSSRLSLAIVARNHLGIDNPNSSLPSPLAPGTAGIFFEDDDWAVGTARASIPRLSQADLVIKIKTKRKTQKRKGTKQGRLGKRVGKNKGRVRLYFT